MKGGTQRRVLQNHNHNYGHFLFPRQELRHNGAKYIHTYTYKHTNIRCKLRKKSSPILTHRPHDRVIEAVIRTVVPATVISEQAWSKQFIQWTWSCDLKNAYPILYVLLTFF